MISFMKCLAGCLQIEYNFKEKREKYVDLKNRPKRMKYVSESEYDICA